MGEHNMRYFQRDSRFYVGPLTESQISFLRNNEHFADSGMACQASVGKIDTYLTLPASNKTRDILEIFKFKVPCA